MKKSKLEKEVLKGITGNRVKMKPKWWFLMVESGARGVWLMTILAVALSVSAIVYFVKLYDLTELREYGDLGTELFIRDFPYLWVVGGMIFFVGGEILLSQIGDNYKRTTRFLLLLTVVGVSVVTVIFLLSGLLLKLGF
jgi:hypothetical protein